MSGEFLPQGVVPACLMPFDNEGGIDLPGYRSHLRDLAGIEGVTGIVVNGHAAEVHALDDREQRSGTVAAAEEVGDRVPIICGIYAESTKTACAMAKAAAADGARALLIFPPNSLMFGGNLRADLGRRYVEEIAAATDLPLVVFQFPVITDLHYDLDSLVGLCEQIDGIVAIKDLCSDPRLHENHIRVLHSLTRPVNVLSSHSMWLAASIAQGARGIISGAGSVIADRQVALFDTVRSGERSATERLRAEMHQFVEAFYGPPYVNWQARMKQVLHRFGRFKSNALRGPLLPIPEDDWNRMQRIFDDLDFTRQSIYAYNASSFRSRA